MTPTAADSVRCTTNGTHGVGVTPEKRTTSKPQRRNAPATSLDQRFELWRASWPTTAV